MGTAPLEKGNKVFQCWGKTDSASTDGSLYHPAIYHMLDVANVSKVILGSQSSPRWRKILSELFPCPSNEFSVSDWLPFFIALHDIGKISAPFQGQNKIQRTRLKNAGFNFGSLHDIPHPLISRNFIWYEWPDNSSCNISETLRKVIREVAGGHHGQFQSPGDLKGIYDQIRFEEPPEWRELRQQAFALILETYPLPGRITKIETTNLSAAVMELTGFTILCDWIGSDQEYFLPQNGKKFEEYKEISITQAQMAVEKDGFISPWLSGISSEFRSIFPGITNPRPLQLAIDEIPDEYLQNPSLTVIEAPTGEGKTEAALALAHRIAKFSGTDEFYYALPTMATSNQMYIRIQKYLYECLGLKTGVKLVHGQSFLMQDALHSKPLSNGGQPEEQWASIEWFNTKKRSLLASFGVGTIDQIELGALNARHVSLRLAGLSGKVVILDEVHAYDTYMTTIVIRLLEWLKALGVSVILLSATLPASKRAELMNVYGGQQEPDQELLHGYPLLQVSSSGKVYCISPKAHQPSHEINIERLSFTENEPAQKAAWLLDKVSEGGCVAWITNTVNRAQEIYNNLLSICPPGIEITLAHARYPLNQRQEIEKKLITLFGPEKSKRPPAAIVVGTQVLEQSLDLDFDAMVSDLAPVDLLLQRSGRLHRHSYTGRPNKLQQPIFYINSPLTQAGDLQITIDSLIYEEYFLRQTDQILKDRHSLCLPDDFRKLVELVYDEGEFRTSETLMSTYQKLLGHESWASQEARQRLIPLPDPGELFTGPMSKLAFTESEENSSWMIAKTRLTGDSITVIPLEDCEEYCQLPGTNDPINKSLPASREEQFAMLQFQISISNEDLVKSLRLQKKKLPQLFSQSPLLSGFQPLWLENGKTKITTGGGEYEICLDNQLGLLIKKGGK